MKIISTCSQWSTSSSTPMSGFSYLSTNSKSWASCEGYCLLTVISLLIWLLPLWQMFHINSWDTSNPSVILSTMHLHYWLNSHINLMPAYSLRFYSFLSKSKNRCSGKAGIQMVSSIRSLVGLVSVTLWKLSVLSTWLSVTIFLCSCLPWQPVTSYQRSFLHLHLTFQAFSSLSGAACTEPVAGLVSSSAILQQDTWLEVNWTCATCLILRY